MFAIQNETYTRSFQICLERALQSRRGDILYVTRNTDTFQTQECHWYNVSRRDESHCNSTGLWSRMSGTSSLFSEKFIDNLKRKSIGLLVMRQAESFTAAFIVAEHVSGDHFIGPISRTTNHVVHCEQVWLATSGSTMTTGGLCCSCPPPGGSSSCSNTRVSQ
jgi:hypothetical protein